MYAMELLDSIGSALTHSFQDSVDSVTGSTGKYSVSCRNNGSCYSSMPTEDSLYYPMESDTAIHSRQAEPLVESDIDEDEEFYSLTTPKLEIPEIVVTDYDQELEEALAEAEQLKKFWWPGDIFRSFLSSLDDKARGRLSDMTNDLQWKCYRESYKFMVNHGYKFMLKGLLLTLSLQVPEYVADAMKVVDIQRELNGLTGRPYYY